jgi:hypothetical protein
MLPISPTLINGSINVDDTNGQTFSFNASGSQSYTQTFSCDKDKGKHDNTATIRETGDKASAAVTVNCYSLTVNKTANTSLTRTYSWTITKSADQTSLTLAFNQSFLVNHKVLVNATSTDSKWAASGTITVHNPAPIDAAINSASDVLSPAAGTTAIDCGQTFPYTLAASGDLVCNYTITGLPDASTRTNTGTATLQNHSYAANGTATPGRIFTSQTRILLFNLVRPYNDHLQVVLLIWDGLPL